MQDSLKDSLESIRMSFALFAPELALSVGILLLIISGLIWKNKARRFHLFTILICSATLFIIGYQWPLLKTPGLLFSGMLQVDQFAAYLKILFLLSGILTVGMTWRNAITQQRLPEYYVLILTIILGAHLVVMSTNFVITFIGLELISISSYVLTGFAFTKTATEGSLKYFMFGSVASATMLYGMSFLYGITGSLDFTSSEFIRAIINNQQPLFFVAATFTLGGFLFKIAAAPFHPWAPDVYEASPMPVIAFFSVVPKLAGLAILSKFIHTINLFGQTLYDWQLILCGIAMLTLTVGNFSALWQKNPKRLMAYSSIAQSGFLLVALAAFVPEGMQFMLFYATIFVLLNFLVFNYLHYFENIGLTTIASYNGVAKFLIVPSVFLLIGFIGLTGLPPTAGFTAKLFIFSALWESYELTGKYLVLALFIIGLLNTVVSLFFYLRIPYASFIQKSEMSIRVNNLTYENLLGLILVLLVLLLFFNPGLLMGWINKINFVI